MKSLFILISCIFVSANANAADVLLYNGSGSTTGDVSALKSQITALGLSYSTATASQINAMTRTQLRTYRLIVWPGGNSITMGRALTTTATNNIHNAVFYDGVSYIGFCAGAFMAERSTYYNTFALANTYFNFYVQGWIATIPIYFPNGARLNVVYWDGPQLSGFGRTVAKYSNGLPAIAESFVGYNNGFVILSGIHPESPTSWGVSGYTLSNQSADNAYARTLISAAYRKAYLPYY
jgi:glutamine amidotransferase-like uncharacterized protein